jgi:hypothetical protein
VQASVPGVQAQCSHQFLTRKHLRTLFCDYSFFYLMT